MEEAPGLTWRMRKMLEKWDNQNELAEDATEEEVSDWKERRRQQRNLYWKWECEDAKCQGILKARKEEAYREAIGQKESGESIYFVTVNPKDDVSLEDLVKHTEKYTAQKHVTSADWVYEQRGSAEEQAGTGKHVHMLVTTKTCKSDFIKRTQGKFKALVGNERHVHISHVKPEWVADKRKYMQGEKTGDGKDVKVQIDKVWREKNNLLPYYTINASTHLQTQEAAVSTGETHEDGSP